MAKSNFIENPTPEQVKKWDEEHGTLIELENEAGNAFYFKSLDSCNNFVQVVSRVLTFIRKDDVVQAGQVLLSNTILGGSFDPGNNSALAVSLGVALIDEVNLPVITKKKKK